MYTPYYEPKTVNGLKFINYCWILYIIGLLILMLVLLAALPTLSEIIEDPDSVEDDDVAPLMGFVGGICLALVVLFIVLILFLVGVVYLLSGKEEFGPEHSSRVMTGFILLVIAFVISIFGGIGGYYIAAGVSAVSTIMYGIGFVFLVEQLLDEKQRKLLWTGGILFIILGISATIINLWLLTTLDIDLQNTQEAGAEISGEFSTYIIISMGLMAMNLFPIILFFISYRAAEARIRSGELKPLIPAYPPPPYGAHYPPPPRGAPYPPPRYGYPPPPPNTGGTSSKCPSCGAKKYFENSKMCNNCGFYFD